MSHGTTLELPWNHRVEGIALVWSMTKVGVVMVCIGLNMWVSFRRNGWWSFRCTCADLIDFVLGPTKWRHVVDEVRVAFIRRHIGGICTIFALVNIVTSLVLLDGREICTQTTFGWLMLVAMTIGRIKRELITTLSTHVSVTAAVLAQILMETIQDSNDRTVLWVHLWATSTCALALEFRVSFILLWLLSLSRLARTGSTSLPGLVFFMMAVSFIQTQAFVAAAIRAVRLATVDDAGVSLFLLLEARFDAVVEVDDDHNVITASPTFYGMISQAVPQTRQEVSTKMLRIMPANPRGSESDGQQGHWALGSPITNVLVDDTDVNILRNTLAHQKIQCQKRRLHEERTLTQEHATACYVTLRANTASPLRVQVFCAACFDVEMSRYRYFLGVCAAEEPPTVQSAGIKLEDEMQMAVFAVDASTPDLKLLTDLTLDSRTLPAGVGLSNVFSEPLFERVKSYLVEKLRFYQQGIRDESVWRYGTIGASTRGGATWIDMVTFELVSHQPATWTEVCEVSVTISRAPQQRASAGSRSNQSFAFHSVPDATRHVSMSGDIVQNLDLESGRGGFASGIAGSFHTQDRPTEPFSRPDVYWCRCVEDASSFWTTPSQTQRSDSQNDITELARKTAPMDVTSLPARSTL